MLSERMWQALAATYDPPKTQCARVITHLVMVDRIGPFKQQAADVSRGNVSLNHVAVDLAGMAGGHALWDAVRPRYYSQDAVVSKAGKSLRVC